MTGEPRLAVFVSPHGFGHAARASALMGSMHGLVGARFQLFASTPTWFFDESVAGQYTYHRTVTDVGLRQKSALRHDARETALALDELLPFDDALVGDLAAEVTGAGCRAVICDIAPLGIAVAERAGLPSVLVESFTWPWLYEPMLEEVPGLRAHAEVLAGWFGRATHHVQTEPLCLRSEQADLHAPPMSRPARRTREAVRSGFGLTAEAPVVVLTMGGEPEALPFLGQLRDLQDVTFLVTGARETRVDGNLHLFDAATRIYMPDLVRAADAVVAKAGYSTIAEVWKEGRPLAFVTRDDFREMGPLREWVLGEIPSFEIPGADFASGAWIPRVSELLTMPTSPPKAEGGADIVARYLVEALEL